MSELTPAVTRLVTTAEQILDLAEELRSRDFRIEALQFALVAAQHLQAATALQRLHDLTAPLGKKDLT